MCSKNPAAISGITAVVVVYCLDKYQAKNYAVVVCFKKKSTDLSLVLSQE